MKVTLVSLLSLFCFSIYGQVAISDQAGSPIPNANAILDLQSSDKGLLLPRISEGARDSIQNPPQGLVIFNTTSSCIQTYLSIQGWTNLVCDCLNPPSAGFAVPPTVTAYAAASFVANTSNVMYSWSFQNGMPNTSNIQNPNVSWSSPGSYNVSLTVTDSLNCSSTSNVTVTVDPCIPPSPSFSGPTSAALNNSISFSALTAGQNYSWTFQGGTPSSSNAQNPSVTWASTGSFQVQLIISDANGCSDTATQTVTVTNCLTGVSDTFFYLGSIESWNVPNVCGNLTIEAWGAQGGDRGAYTGGLGARTRGEFSVSPSTQLRIVVGEKPPVSSTCCGSSGAGGGGGSFVWINGQTAEPLVAAGGGGGAESSNANGYPGLTGTSGGSAVAPGGAGGVNGLGGGSQNNWYDGAGGAGWKGNGQNSSCGSPTVEGGFSLPTFAGGVDNCGGSGVNNRGGFGGGGAFHHGGGGGGGYSGGGGGSNANNMPGGGGGSYNGGSNVSSSSGVKAGHGMVIISY